MTWFFRQAKNARRERKYHFGIFFEKNFAYVFGCARGKGCGGLSGVHGKGGVCGKGVRL
jgi:hypothetical protein